MKNFKLVWLLVVFVWLGVSADAQVLKLKSDSSYSADLSTTLTIGATMYIQLDGVEGWHSGAGNDNTVASVIVSNTTTGDKINVALTEALENVFRGTAKVTNTTSDPLDTIAASSNDTLIVKLVPPSMTEDGNTADWQNGLFQKLVDISDGFSPSPTHEFINITNLYVTSDYSNVYILYEMNGVVDCGSNQIPHWETVFDTVSTTGDKNGTYGPWWVWVENAPVGSGYTNNAPMYADYCVRAAFAQGGTAGSGFFGDGSTVNQWNGSAWVITGTNKPASGFPGDHNKTSGNFVEIKIPLSYIGNPTGWCGVATKGIDVDGSWTINGYDLVPNDTASPHSPLWFMPSKYVKTSVGITTVPQTNTTPSTNANTTAITYSDLAETIAYPTIVKESKKIVFANLSETAKVKIYTLTGQLVKELTDTVVNGKIEWDFADFNLAHGVYIAYITDDKGNKKIEKFIYQK